MNIGKSIKSGLERTGNTQRWLHEVTGWSQPYISMLATGKKGASLSTVNKLAAAFGVPASEFIKWGEE